MSRKVFVAGVGMIPFAKPGASAPNVSEIDAWQVSHTRMRLVIGTRSGSSWQATHAASGGLGSRPSVAAARLSW